MACYKLDYCKWEYLYYYYRCRGFCLKKLKINLKYMGRCYVWFLKKFEGECEGKKIETKK